jgi:predicted esterase
MEPRPHPGRSGGWLLGLVLCATVALGGTPDGGGLQPNIAARADPAQRYDLYLPPGYPGGRKWPALIILDPRGRTEWVMERARPAAAANGWLVLASHQSRSDDREQITLDALQALLRELATQYRYDPRRVYVAGMSGTAKSLWVVDQAAHGLVAGYFGAGGGRPPELAGLKAAGPAFFGYAARHDFNFQEMRDLDAQLARAGGPHRLENGDGGHGWPEDPAMFTAAIDWLELIAMVEGRTPRREDWIDAQLAARRAQAAAAATPLERWRAFEQLLRDFRSLRQLKDERASAARWQADPATRSALKLEARLHEEEARFAHQFDAWVGRFDQRSLEGRRQAPPDVGRTIAELRLRTLRERTKDSDRMVADSAARRLERVWVASAHYVPDARHRQGDAEGERAALALAVALFPERGYARCRLAALDSRKRGETADDAPGDCRGADARR